MTSSGIERVNANMGAIQGFMEAAVAGGIEKNAEDLRRWFARKPFRTDPDIEVQSLAVAGMLAEWVLAPGIDPDLRVLYLHGGGYIMGNVETHRDMAARISRASGAAVLTIDYRLAPEHPFPAALEDAEKALAFIEAHGPGGRQRKAAAVFLGGDSAGGGLALALLMKVRDAGGAMVQGAVLFSPWTDLTLSGEGFRQPSDPAPAAEGSEPDGKSDPTMMGKIAAAYLAGSDPKAPLASPLFGDYKGLPPLLIQAGGAETIVHDTTRVAERARAAGVEVVEDIWPGMFHVFQGYAPLVPEGRHAIERAGGFIRAQVARLARSA